MKHSNANTTRYEAVGDVRGSCGHRHRRGYVAQRCAERDHAACRALGGGAYSDRVVYKIHPDGRRERAQVGGFEFRELRNRDIDATVIVAGGVA